MSAKTPIRPLTALSLMSCMLIGCFHPPFNGFKPDHRPVGVSSISPQMRENTLIKLLRKHEIEFIKYGDRRTLILPTDRYFIFNTSHLNDICYTGLNEVIFLLKTYPYSTIYVAAFSDDVGSRKHKTHLTQAQAEAMLTFLWANGIHAEQLQAEGHANQYAKIGRA